MYLAYGASFCLFTRFVTPYVIYVSSGSSSWSSPGSGGSNDPLTYYAGQCDTYAEFSNTVSNATTSVLLDDDDYGIWENKNWTGIEDVPSANLHRGPTDAASSDINWLMDIYDAYYNGTVTMTLEPDANNATTASCATFKSQPIEDAYLRIGPRSRNDTDRSVYDNNDLYLAIGRSFKQDKCPDTPNKVFFAVESSSSLTTYGTTWSLNATKSADGNGFDIEGSMQSRRAAYNNHYNYQVNVTDPGFVKDDTNSSCPNWFFTQALTSLYSPSLAGTVTAEAGKVTWSFLDYFYGYKVTAVFEGKAWNKGPKLDTNGAAVATTGEAKRVVWKSTEPSTAERFKWVIIGCVIGGVIILGWLVYKCCCCLSRNKPAKESSTYIQQGQTWQR